MTAPVLLCTDGSDLAIRALNSGLDVVGPDADVVLVAAVEAADPFLATGGGLAGPTMSPEQLAELDQDLDASARATLEATAAALGLAGAPTAVLRGDPGPAVCAYAAEVGARAIVVGSRGRSGFRRALLGSVSDHVVRNAPCPVVVVTAQSDDGGDGRATDG